MLKVVRFLIVFLSAGFFVSSASAAPATFVYQGQILDEFAIPVEAASVSFKIQIFSPMPSKCLLYEESFSPVNMTDSNGLFALPIGTGTVSPSSQYSTLLDVFDNSLGSVSPTICEGVASYDANDGDLRYIRVTFNKGAGDFVVPDRPMYSAPFALNAARVGGLTENNILQVNVAAPAVLSQSNLEWVFESTRFPELQNLINGSSSQYMSSTPSSAPNFNGQIVDNIASPADGDDATNKNYVDARLGGQLVNSVVNSPGAAQDGYALVWDNSTNRYTLVEGSSALGDHLGNHTATTNLIMGANYISNDGTASQGLSFDGSNNANFSQDLTVSQGFSVTNGITSAGPIQLNGQQELRLFDSDSSNYVAHRAAGTTTSNYTVQWPAAGPGSANLILRSDASGVLSWTTDTITSVFSRTGDVVAQSGDYTAAQVTNVAAGGIAATNVQAAVNELDSEKVAKGGDLMSGNLSMDNEREVRFEENAVNGDNYVALKAPALLGADLTFELPVNYGSGGDVLTSDGSGGLSWTTPPGGDVTGAANVGAGAGQIFRDETTGTLNLKTIAAGSTRLSVTNNANDVTLDVVEANINHDNLSGFVANEHIDHSGVSIATAPGTSGLSGGGNITATRNLAIDIAGTADVASVQGADTLLIRDDSDSGNLKEISRTNFVLSESEVDAFVSNNGYGDVASAANVGSGAGQLFRDETSGTLNIKSIAAGSSKLSVTNNANDVSLDVVEANINHDSLAGFVANEHIDHTSVSINTNSGSALSGGGNISASRNLQVQVDNSSIEISSNALRLRALGVQNSHLANDSVNSAKIDNGSIIDADVSASAALSRSKLATGNNNRVLINNGSGQMAEAAAITPNRALASDANGLPVAGSATRSELGHLSGVTSNLQTQLNGKQNSLGYTPVDVSGDSMTGALAVVAGSAAAPGLQVSGDSNTGIFSSGSDTLSISTAGSEAVFVNASGNVGVGSGSPQARLDVNGGVRVGGDADGCVSTKEGTVRFNGVTKQLQVCDGSSWSTIGGSFVTVSPPGSITTMMTASCPTGFLAADGSAVSRSTYSDLFAAIGVMYGNGNGSTTFNVPDMRGYFIRGVDGGAGNDPDAASRTDRGDGTTGDAVGTKQGDEIKAHNHGNGTLGGTTSSDGAHTHGTGSLGGTTNTAGAHTHAKGTLGGTTNTAGAHSHSYSDYYRNGADVDGGDGGTGISGLANASRTTSSAGAHSHTLNITGSTASAGAHSHTLNITGSTASAGAHSHTLNITGSIASHGGSESRPKNINALYCIKY